MELDRIPGSRQIATSENEDGFVAVRPSQPFGFKIQRSFIGSRPHDVAIDRFEESLGEFWIKRIPAFEFVRGLEPVDAPVFSSDEAVEARRHVNRYARISDCPRIVFT